MDKYLDIKNAKTLLPLRSSDSNKGTFGKVFNIAGSKAYQGAAYLSSIASLKTGAGLVTLGCPDCILDNIASQAPSITYFPLASFNDKYIASMNSKAVIEKSREYTVISIGCGIGTAPSTLNFVNKFLKHDFEQPVIIDADALNSISYLGIIKLPSKTIITPHPKELSRLMDIPVQDINSKRTEYAIAAAKKYNCITVLKGNKTVITDGKKVYINQTGNSGLAKAGSGDVLTGIISGLCAQNLSIFDSAMLGCYIHGLCADIAAENLTQYSILSTDLIDYIPQAIKKILNQS